MGSPGAGREIQHRAGGQQQKSRKVEISELRSRISPPQLLPNSDPNGLNPIAGLFWDCEVPGADPGCVAWYQRSTGIQNITSVSLTA